MSEHVLIQQQRAILVAFRNAFAQYQQQVNQAKERLDNALARIQTAKNKAEQEAKQEYEQIKQKVSVVTIARTSLEMAEKQEYPAISSNDIEWIRKQLHTIEQEKIHDPRLSTWSAIVGAGVSLAAFPALIGIFLLVAAFTDFSSDNFFTTLLAGFACIAPLLILVPFLYWLPKKQRSIASERAPRFVSLYRRWLELIAEQARAQEAQARQAYQQAMAQAEAQLNTAREQFKSAAAEYTRLVEQTSPSWQDPAWQDWQPAASITGVVRLGAFKEVTNVRPRLIEVKIIDAGRAVPGSSLPENKEK